MKRGSIGLLIWGSVAWLVFRALKGGESAATVTATGAPPSSGTAPPRGGIAPDVVGTPPVLGPGGEVILAPEATLPPPSIGGGGFPLPAPTTEPAPIGRTGKVSDDLGPCSALTDQSLVGVTNPSTGGQFFCRTPDGEKVF